MDDVIEITANRIDPDELRASLFDAGAGAYCGFEGWIRNENDGQAVLRLEYEAYAPLAQSEGEKYWPKRNRISCTCTRTSCIGQACWRLANARFGSVYQQRIATRRFKPVDTSSIN